MRQHHDTISLSPCVDWATPGTVAVEAEGVRAADVLVVTDGPAPHLAALATEFNIRHIGSPAVPVLAEILSTATAPIVVLDAKWAVHVDPHALSELRRRVHESKWLLIWEQPSRQWVSYMLAVGIVGALSPAESPARWRTALVRVMAGEIWLPRTAAGWLFELARDAAISPTALAAAHLTPREAETLGWMRQGFTNKAIAQRLGVSPNTVKKYVAGLLAKTGFHNRRQAR